MALTGARSRITEEILTWKGTSALPHRFGGTEYRLGTREIGHIHGDHMIDIPFPRRIRDEVVANGLAEPHHLLPETGWVSFYLRSDGDIEKGIDLLQQSYEIASRQRQKRQKVVK